MKIPFYYLLGNKLTILGNKNRACGPILYNLLLIPSYYLLDTKISFAVRIVRWMADGLSSPSVLEQCHRTLGKNNRDHIGFWVPIAKPRFDNTTNL